ncbi:MAG: hypothetical protein Q8N77_01085 [Nanoarchaeota archaeon]|nr:hypothetical protein [Nanoarchaeota archaeon]
MVFVALLAVPMVSYADCASDCVNKCAPLGSGKEYATCLQNCLKGCYDTTPVPPVPSPTPANLSQEKEIEITNLVLASDTPLIAQRLPCYGGGSCPRLLPYKNLLNDECYATLKKCKEADGDLQNTPGDGFCVRCGN